MKPTGGMLEARLGNTMTLLQDGRILAAGGYVLGTLPEGFHSVPTAEIYYRSMPLTVRGSTGRRTSASLFHGQEQRRSRHGLHRRAVFIWSTDRQDSLESGCRPQCCARLREASGGSC
jgi:hypothetical protein